MAYSLLVTYNQRVTKVEKKLKMYQAQLNSSEFFSDAYIDRIRKAWAIVRKTKGGCLQNNSDERRK